MQSLNFKKNFFSILMLASTFLVGGKVEGQTATYTVASVSSVTTSGITPSGSSATFSQTYTTAGQMTSGKSTTLTLSGYSGKVISSIVLNMKSNNSAGAGNLSVVAGSNTILSITGGPNFNTSSWYGAWSASFVNITKTPTAYTVGSGENVVITISATVNSLYINSYSITYAAPVTSPTITGAATTAPFTSTFGTASTAQTFSVSGSNLTASVNATAPTGFEVSSDGTTYGSTAAFTQSSGSASGTLYIRLSASAPVGTYNSQNIVLSSTGATNVNITTPSSGNAVTCSSGTWIGGATGNFNTASNWCGGVPSPGSNLTIPAGTTVTLDGSTEVEVGNLTINTTGALLLPSTAKLTVNGVLTNNGTMTIESGATFKQGQSSSLASNTTGTFNVKQFVTGAGGATPNGRFWYMGVPISNLTRAGAFGAASGANRLWSWTESTGWSAQLTDNTTLNPKTGYVFRTGSDVTLNFSGTSLYADNVGVSGLTNNNGSFAGCNLLSNPYTAYLNWVDVYNASTGISSTYCIPTSNGTSMVYDTYNASGFVSANPSGTAMTNFIAPMQAFWAVVNPGSTGTISMTKAMLSHQPTALGLKDLVSNSAFARLNLVSGSFSDQVVVYTDVNATAELEDYDSKKFFVANAPQVYCKVGEDKLVINALKKGKAHTTAPLTLELPTSQVYQFEMVESFVENGVVLLEDRQEGIFQDMGVNPVYEFYGALGLLSDRFVLHFQHPNIGIDEGQAGLDEVTSSTINVLSNQNGIINVSLSSDLTASGEVQILDASGRLVQTALIKGQETKLQITEGVGVYFVRVLTPIKSEMKKVMVY